MSLLYINKVFYWFINLYNHLLCPKISQQPFISGMSYRNKLSIKFDSNSSTVLYSLFIFEIPEGIARDEINSQFIKENIFPVLHPVRLDNQEYLLHQIKISSLSFINGIH